MVAFLTQLLLAIRSRFMQRAQLEAEKLLLVPTENLIQDDAQMVRMVNEAADWSRF